MDPSWPSRHPPGASSDPFFDLLQPSNTSQPSSARSTSSTPVSTSSGLDALYQAGGRLPRIDDLYRFGSGSGGSATNPGSGGGGGGGGVGDSGGSAAYSLGEGKSAQGGGGGGRYAVGGDAGAQVSLDELFPATMSMHHDAGDLLGDHSKDPRHQRPLYMPSSSAATSSASAPSSAPAGGAAMRAEASGDFFTGAPRAGGVGLPGGGGGAGGGGGLGGAFLGGGTGGGHAEGPGAGVGGGAGAGGGANASGSAGAGGSFGQGGEGMRASAAARGPATAGDLSHLTGAILGGVERLLQRFAGGVGAAVGEVGARVGAVESAVGALQREGKRGWREMGERQVDMEGRLRSVEQLLLELVLDS
ncbi:hypothetical protein CLOP_g5752 [Closterium sp. NIES-67]|nr:hypothetical protein CLOP_g5752 [Closterium sp. NIES-67]